MRALLAVPSAGVGSSFGVAAPCIHVSSKLGQFLSNAWYSLQSKDLVVYYFNFNKHKTCEQKKIYRLRFALVKDCTMQWGGQAVEWG